MPPFSYVSWYSSFTLHLVLQSTCPLPPIRPLQYWEEMSDSSLLPYWWSTLNWLALLSNPSRPLSHAALCGCLALLPEFSSLNGSLPACLSGSSPSPWWSIFKPKSGCLLRPIHHTSLPKINNCILWCPSLVQTPRQQASGTQPLSTCPSPPLLPQSPCSNVTHHQRVKRRPMLSPPTKCFPSLHQPCSSPAVFLKGSYCPSRLVHKSLLGHLPDYGPFPTHYSLILSSLTIALCLYFNKLLVYTSPPILPFIQNRVYILVIFVPLVLPRFNEWTVSIWLYIII